MWLRLARSTRRISIAGLPSKVGSSTRLFESERTLRETGGYPGKPLCGASVAQDREELRNVYSQFSEHRKVPESP